jgi:type I restriction enzyme M protein
MCWAMCSNTSWRVRAGRGQAGRPVLHPAQHGGTAGGRCWSPTRAACSTPAAAAAACSCSRRSSSPSTRARSTTSIYGQESNQTTWRLAKMNLAIRGMDSSQVKWNNEGSFLNDAHKDLKADLHHRQPALQRERLERRPAAHRWPLAIRRAARGQRQLRLDAALHLPPQPPRAGRRGAGQGRAHQQEQRRRRHPQGHGGGGPHRLHRQPARQALPQHPDPGQPVVHEPRPRQRPPRKGEILFIDARNLGHLINRRTREFSDEDINTIAATYHAWRTGEGGV